MLAGFGLEKAGNNNIFTHHPNRTKHADLFSFFYIDINRDCIVVFKTFVRNVKNDYVYFFP